MSDTALMEQYRALKAQHPGALLLFQIGDFYETFEEDAHIVSTVLGITLTRRNNGAAGDVPLAGFPIRALDTYLPKLIEAGYRVAICDQVEDPKKAKKIVRREVTQLVTPGVFWEGEEGSEKALYVATFWAYNSTEAALALADVVSSGRVFYFKGPLGQVEGVLSALQPVEGLVYVGQESLWNALFSGAQRVEALPEWYFDPAGLAGAFVEVYGYESPRGSIVYGTGPEAAVLAALLAYLRTLKQTGLPHLSFPRPLPAGEVIVLPSDTLRHLEVLEPLHPEGKSLFQVLRLTVTPAGARLLRNRLCFPLRRREAIERRLALVEALFAHLEGQALWQERLQRTGDLERRVARLSSRRAGPRDLVQIYWALQGGQQLAETLPATYNDRPEALSFIPMLLHLLERYLDIQPNPPYIGERPGEGKVIRAGVSETLDRARHLAENAELELQRLEEQERQRLNIPSLKIQANKQLGYVFHITAAHLAKIPPEYRLRQQLAQGAARYSSEALDRLAAEIEAAQNRIAEEETRLYGVLLAELQSYVPTLQALARWVASVDVHLALAVAAHRYGYTRPTFTDEPEIHIRKGRHPVIERFLPPHQPYQPNDLVLKSDQRILLLTGPNMAGKSAYMRQNALILLMAQIGSFVPAESAMLTLVDQIFTRVGASDNIAAGQSTFLVEMQETARILYEATARSFVILDEIGRGTSTYDGLALAWAVLEYLHNDPHCRPWTLFATHYHELTELEQALPRLRNFHLAVEQQGGKLIFLHRLRTGAMRRSFGIAVAEMAGLPPAILQRAQTLLRHLEKHEPLLPAHEPTLFHTLPDTEGELRRRLLEIDPNTLTPIEALFRLQELRQIAQKT